MRSLARAVERLLRDFDQQIHFGKLRRGEKSLGSARDRLIQLDFMLENEQEYGLRGVGSRKVVKLVCDVEIRNELDLKRAVADRHRQANVSLSAIAHFHIVPRGSRRPYKSYILLHRIRHAFHLRCTLLENVLVRSAYEIRGVAHAHLSHRGKRRRGPMMSRDLRFELVVLGVGRHAFVHIIDQQVLQSREFFQIQRKSEQNRLDGDVGVHRALADRNVHVRVLDRYEELVAEALFAMPVVHHGVLHGNHALGELRITIILGTNINHQRLESLSGVIILANGVVHTRRGVVGQENGLVLESEIVGDLLGIGQEGKRRIANGELEHDRRFDPQPLFAPLCVFSGGDSLGLHAFLGVYIEGSEGRSGRGIDVVHHGLIGVAVLTDLVRILLQLLMDIATFLFAIGRGLHELVIEQLAQQGRIEDYWM